MRFWEALWSLLPDRCEMPDCKRAGVRGNENNVGGKVVCDYCQARMPGAFRVQNTVADVPADAEEPINLRTAAEIEAERRAAKKPRKFRLDGKVFKDSEAGTVLLASGSAVKEAESAAAVKAAWEADMKAAFPMGPDYNVDYVCEVTEVP